MGRCLHHCRRLKVVVSIVAIPLREDFFCLRRRVPLHVSWQDEPLQVGGYLVGKRLASKRVRSTGSEPSSSLLLMLSFVPCSCQLLFLVVLVLWPLFSPPPPPPPPPTTNITTTTTSARRGSFTHAWPSPPLTPLLLGAAASSSAAVRTPPLPGLGPRATSLQWPWGCTRSWPAQVVSFPKNELLVHS